ncbi:copper chaperone PCu(A)C [Streptacidiphilus anmyonensis]|uniref:copper chaperone PCu(A)C n=1 Tax=Streptacidiphilus anmyonensis TaxID=405782 RepID=UPI0005A9A1B1|nr:copper chaperone PCu(A)C [Streptacidiphilus anmyonensis]
MRRRTAALGAVALAAPLALALTGCSSSGGATGPATTSGSATSSAAAGSAAAAPRLSVSGAYIPLPSLPDMAAGYFVLRNDGDKAATLTGVTSPQAQSVSMHQSTASTMVDTPTVRIPAHGVVTFARGGRHLMLMGLKPAPKLGAQIELQLRFDDAAPVTVQATVQPLTYQPGQ